MRTSLYRPLGLMSVLMFCGAAVIAWQELARHSPSSVGKELPLELPARRTDPARLGQITTGLDERFPAGNLLHDHRPESAVSAIAEHPRENSSNDQPEAFRSDLANFASWLDQYVGCPTQNRPALIPQGIELSKRRRQAMAELIRRDPAAALAAAIPMSQRLELPPTINALLEERVSGRGNLSLVGATPAPGQTSSRALWHSAFIDGREYEAYVYGRRSFHGSRTNIWLHGIAVAGAMAVHESPLAQQLEPTDEAAADAIAGEIGGEGGSLPARLDTSRTLGVRRVLVIRVDFPDRPGEPLTQDAALTLINTTANGFFQEISYGKAGLSGTATTNVLRLPERADYYATNQFNDLLHQHARGLATATGYDLSSFDRVAVAFVYLGDIPNSRIGYGALGEINGRNCWLNGFFEHRFITHELGHNYGVAHANFWQTSDNSVVGGGQSIEYKDFFDTMGEEGGSNAYHYNPWFKYMLNWLTDANVVTVTNSGTYRVRRFDHRNAAGVEALRLPRGDGVHDYWIGLRQAFPNDPTVFNGAYIVWGYRTLFRQSDLLDMTPGSRAGTDDAHDPGLAVGRTFSDETAGIVVHPLAKGGSSPGEYLDLQIEVRSGAPAVTIEPRLRRMNEGETVTLTATATGTFPLRYQWFRSGFEISGATNASYVLTNATFTNSGPYTVMLTNRFGIALGLAGSLIVGPTRLVAWGNNDSGQTNIPATLTNIAAIAAGERHSVALRDDGTVLSWGANDFGQTDVPGDLTEVIAISSMHRHNLALRRDGTVRAWGWNMDGQATIPIGLTGVVSIAAGHVHNLALKRDGTIASWGGNPWNQTNVPTSLHGAIAVAAGLGHSLALQPDGRVMAWGLNTDLQATVPTAVTGVVAVAAGAQHSVGLQKTGAVTGWGSDSDGQSSIPLNLSRARWIAAGQGHNLAVLESGGIVAWGRNTAGQTTLPPDLAGALFVAAGGEHSLALLASQEAVPQLVVTPAVRDFGLLTVGTTRLQAFFLRNAGLQPLDGTANLVPVSGPFTFYGATAFHLRGGQVGIVIIRFSPLTVGDFAAEVAFDSSGGRSTNVVTGQAMTETNTASPRLVVLGPTHFGFVGVADGHSYRIDTSTNLIQWEPYLLVTNFSGRLELMNPMTGSSSLFFRAQREE